MLKALPLKEGGKKSSTLVVSDFKKGKEKKHCTRGQVGVFVLICLIAYLCFGATCSECCRWEVGKGNPCSGCAWCSR